MVANLKAHRTTRLAIALSRKYADAGNVEAARRWWLLASRIASFRCGGLSGALWAGDGYGAVVIDNGPTKVAFVAHSPVPLFDRETRRAA